MRPLNVVVLTTRLFSRPAGGGELCTARLIDALQRAGHGVRVIGRGSAAATLGQAREDGGDGGDGAAPETRPLQVFSVGPLVLPLAELGPWQRLLSLLGAWWRGCAWTVHRLQQGGVPARVRALLASWQVGQDWPVDAVVVDHLQTLSWLPPAGGRLPAPVVVMHNLEAAGYAEQAARAATEGRWLALVALRREQRLVHALEAQVASRAAAVACLSEPDAQVWRSRLGRARANEGQPGGGLTVEVLAGHPAIAGGGLALVPAGGWLGERPARAQRWVGVVGTWTWGPNREGLEWLLRVVWPQVGPHCRLLVAGSGSRELVLPAGAQALGWVDDLAAFYAGLDVVALSSHSGSGVHEKAIEALVLAPVVVATPHALRGLGPQLPAHVCVAADAARFAHLCQHAQLDGPSRRLAQDSVLAWALQRRQAHDQALARCLVAAQDRRGRPAAAVGGGGVVA